jgi:surface polysaccharide O-acyltransferase-like enzyme
LIICCFKKTCNYGFSKLNLISNDAPKKGAINEKGKKLIKERGLAVPVDLIRAVAIFGVLLLHSSNDMSPAVMNQWEIYRWLTVDVYQSLGRIGVPLFVMLTGVLLLQPSKTESLKAFFKKRWARLGLPFFFWGTLYFVYIYLTHNNTITANTIINGWLNGPYMQFWYIYMLAGLYLLTPILRVLIAHIDAKTMKYFIVLWVLSASIVPLITYFTSITVNSGVFTVTGWVGYYILGIYLLDVKISRKYLVAFMSLGVALAAAGTVYMAWNYGGPQTWYFQDYLSPTMILTSVMAFLLLNTIKMPSYRATPTSTSLTQKLVDSEPSEPSKSRKLLKVISENTLPIFFLHLMVIETIQKGYLGFTINGSTINSVVGVPLVAVITLFVCLAIIMSLKKVPVLKKLIG